MPPQRPDALKSGGDRADTNALEEPAGESIMSSSYQAEQLEALRLTVMEPGTSIRDVGMNHGIPYSTLRHRSRQGLSTLRRKLRIRAKKNGLE